MSSSFSQNNNLSTPKHEKKSKFQALNINTIFRGKGTESHKAGKAYGFQSITKVTSSKRLPPPLLLPSKSENQNSNELIPVNSGVSWVNKENSENENKADQKNDLGQNVITLKTWNVTSQSSNTEKSLSNQAFSSNYSTIFQKEFPSLSNTDSKSGVSKNSDTNELPHPNFERLKRYGSESELKSNNMPYYHLGPQTNWKDVNNKKPSIIPNHFDYSWDNYEQYYSTQNQYYIRDDGIYKSEKPLAQGETLSNLQPSVLQPYLNNKIEATSLKHLGHGYPLMRPSSYDPYKPMNHNELNNAMPQLPYQHQPKYEVTPYSGYANKGAAYLYPPAASHFYMANQQPLPPAPPFTTNRYPPPQPYHEPPMNKGEYARPPPINWPDEPTFNNNHYHEKQHHQNWQSPSKAYKTNQMMLPDHDAENCMYNLGPDDHKLYNNINDRRIDRPNSLSNSIPNEAEFGYVKERKPSIIMQRNVPSQPPQPSPPYICSDNEYYRTKTGLNEETGDFSVPPYPLPPIRPGGGGYYMQMPFRRRRTSSNFEEPPASLQTTGPVGGVKAHPQSSYFEEDWDNTDNAGAYDQEHFHHHRGTGSHPNMQHHHQPNMVHGNYHSRVGGRVRYPSSSQSSAHYGPGPAPQLKSDQNNDHGHWHPSYGTNHPQRSDVIYDDKPAPSQLLPHHPSYPKWTTKSPSKVLSAANNNCEMFNTKDDTALLNCARRPNYINSYSSDDNDMEATILSSDKQLSKYQWIIEGDKIIKIPNKEVVKNMENEKTSGYHHQASTNDYYTIADDARGSHHTRNSAATDATIMTDINTEQHKQPDKRALDRQDRKPQPAHYEDKKQSSSSNRRLSGGTATLSETFNNVSSHDHKLNSHHQRSLAPKDPETTTSETFTSVSSFVTLTSNSATICTTSSSNNNNQAKRFAPPGTSSFSFKPLPPINKETRTSSVSSRQTHKQQQILLEDVAEACVEMPDFKLTPYRELKSLKTNSKPVAPISSSSLSPGKRPGGVLSHKNGSSSYTSMSTSPSCAKTTAVETSPPSLPPNTSKSFTSLKDFTMNLQKEVRQEKAASSKVNTTCKKAVESSKPGLSSVKRAPVKQQPFHSSQAQRGSVGHNNQFVTSNEKPKHQHDDTAEIISSSFPSKGEPTKRYLNRPYSGSAATSCAGEGAPQQHRSKYEPNNRSFGKDNLVKKQPGQQLKHGGPAEHVNKTTHNPSIMTAVQPSSSDDNFIKGKGAVPVLPPTTTTKQPVNVGNVISASSKVLSSPDGSVCSPSGWANEEHEWETASESSEKAAATTFTTTSASPLKNVASARLSPLLVSQQNEGFVVDPPSATIPSHKLHSYHHHPPPIKREVVVSSNSNLNFNQYLLQSLHHGGGAATASSPSPSTSSPFSEKNNVKRLQPSVTFPKQDCHSTNSSLGCAKPPSQPIKCFDRPIAPTTQQQSSPSFNLFTDNPVPPTTGSDFIQNSGSCWDNWSNAATKTISADGTTAAKSISSTFSDVSSNWNTPNLFDSRHHFKQSKGGNLNTTVITAKDTGAMVHDGNFVSTSAAKQPTPNAKEYDIDTWASIPFSQDVHWSPRFNAEKEGHDRGDLKDKKIGVILPSKALSSNEIANNTVNLNASKMWPQNNTGFSNAPPSGNNCSDEGDVNNLNALKETDFDMYKLIRQSINTAEMATGLPNNMEQQSGVATAVLHAPAMSGATAPSPIINNTNNNSASNAEINQQQQMMIQILAAANMLNIATLAHHQHMSNSGSTQQHQGPPGHLPAPSLTTPLTHARNFIGNGGNLVSSVNNVTTQQCGPPPPSANMLPPPPLLPPPTLPRPGTAQQQQTSQLALFPPPPPPGTHMPPPPPSALAMGGNLMGTANVSSGVMQSHMPPPPPPPHHHHHQVTNNPNHLLSMFHHGPVVAHTTASPNPLMVPHNNINTNPAGNEQHHQQLLAYMNSHHGMGNAVAPGQLSPSELIWINPSNMVTPLNNPGNGGAPDTHQPKFLQP